MNSLSLTDFPETLLKSFVNVQHLDLDVVEKKIVENFQKGLISEELFNNSLDILEKAGATKYIRREGSPGNYKYIYKEEDGSKKTSQVDKYKIRSVDGKFLLLEDGKALGSYDTYEQAFGAVERITKKESSKKPLKDKDDIFAGNLQDVPKGTRLRDKEGNLYIVTPKTMYGSGDVRDSGDEIRVQYLEDGSTYTTTLSRDFL
jgi:hypothetical protein